MGGFAHPMTAGLALEEVHSIRSFHISPFVFQALQCQSERHRNIQGGQDMVLVDPRMSSLDRATAFPEHPRRGCSGLVAE